MINVSASATSGKEGSSDSDLDPGTTPDVTGTSGLVSATRNAIAGPVPPGAIVSLPGTDGISVGNAISAVNFLNGGHTMVTTVSAQTSFANLDGGGYSANASASYNVDFFVTEDTPYTLVGDYSVDDQDVLWKLQLLGQDGFLINNGTTALDAGSINTSGILKANTDYRLSATVSIGSSGLEAPGESSLINATLNIVPEPTSAALLALPGIALLRRRRR